MAPAFAPQIGDPGLLRLLRPGVADQASWLLPLALLGLFVGAWQVRPRAAGGAADAGQAVDERARRQRVALLIWGLWLLGWAAYFSVARFYHLYYLIMLGPAVAALTGVAVVSLCKEFRTGRAWTLPLALIGTIAVQAFILTTYPVLSAWLAPLLVVTGLVAVVVLVGALWMPRPWVAMVGATLGSLALLLAPTVWSVASVHDGNGGGWLVQAGPGSHFSGRGPGGSGFGDGGRQGFPGGDARGQPNAGAGVPGNRGQGPGGPWNDGQAPRNDSTAFGNTGGRAAIPSRGGGPMGPGDGGGLRPLGGSGAFTFSGERWNSLDPGLVHYLRSNQGTARYLVATASSSYASLFILATEQPALALGGYQGWDRILTTVALGEWVADGTIRFFYLGTASGSAGGQDATGDLTAWVRTSCAVVPAERWQSVQAGEVQPGINRPTVPVGRGGRRAQSEQLYDCL